MNVRLYCLFEIEMALQGKFLRFYTVLNNIKNVSNTTTTTVTHWYNYPCIQQIAGLRQSLEEKLNIPPKPKRPLTPYFKFMAQVRPEIKKENPKANATDIVREISHRWEKIDPKRKEELEAEFKKEQAIYSKVRLEYDTQLTPVQRELLKEARQKQVEVKEKRKLKQKCREYNKPKKPASAFVLYMKSELPSRDGKDFRTFQKIVADGWSKLTDAQKKPFVDESQAMMKEYQKVMVDWERKMIKLGNTDIVRQDALLDPTPKATKSRRTHKKTE